MKFEYQKHHWEFMEKYNTPAEVINNWPFDDMIPSYRSVYRRLKTLKKYGIEKCLERPSGMMEKSSKWTKDEEKCLALAYELSQNSEDEAYKLFKDIYPKRTRQSINTRLSILAANGKIERTYHNTKSDLVDYYEFFLQKGFIPVNNSTGYSHTYFDLECIEYGHKSRAKVSALSGCNVCAQAGSMPLSQLKNHELGQHPCIIYFVQFEDGTLKTGHTKNETQLRGRDWPPFKIIKEIETTYYHARRIETETQNQCDRMPEYLPLQGNGGTECFEEKHYERILQILNKEEKDLLEHEKNSS